jgi:hypothetical protein
VSLLVIVPPPRLVPTTYPIARPAERPRAVRPDCPAGSVIGTSVLHLGSEEIP